jgi:tRNA G10  N-methylase Trm11
MSDTGECLASAYHSQAKIDGLTHLLYRYPARFSPQFARTVVDNFAKPGGVVIDPFMGGGTSAVEALAMGRRFLGIDINPLSIVIARAKTTPLSKPGSTDDVT